MRVDTTHERCYNKRVIKESQMALEPAQPLLQINSEIDKVKGKNHKLPKSVRKCFNEESLEVLRHFGVNAPFLLNEYSCSLEDELIEKVRENSYLKLRLAELSGELYKLQQKDEFGVDTTDETML